MAKSSFNTKDLHSYIKRKGNFDNVFSLFLCKETMKKAKDFIENSSNKPFEKVNELWKDLLMDSICVLKINDRREDINTKFTKSSKITNLIKDIRLLSSYGIDELNSYIDDFVSFESVLYGSDPFYRDHVHHTINVWLIGLVLLTKNDNYSKFVLSDKLCLQEIDYSNEIEIDSLKGILLENKFDLSRSELFAIWTITALCHDLGYPLEKATSINKNIRNILEQFGRLDVDEFSYNFTPLHSILVDKFINITSSKVMYKRLLEDEAYKTKINSFSKLDDLFSYKIGITSIQSKYHDKISKSFEDYNHGVLSGYLLFKTLTYFLETDYSYAESQPLTYEDSRQFIIRKEILRAITGHTCPKLYHLNMRNLAFLLIISDELHEWERPRFDDFRSGPPADEETSVELSNLKFSSPQKDSLHYQDALDVCISYLSKKFYSSTKEYEKGILKKFRFFHHLIRSAKDDKDRGFDFKWKYSYSPDKDCNGKSCEYIFEFSPSSTTNFSQFSTKIIVDGISHNFDFYSSGSDRDSKCLYDHFHKLNQSKKKAKKTGVRKK